MSRSQLHLHRMGRPMSNGTLPPGAKPAATPAPKPNPNAAAPMSIAFGRVDAQTVTLTLAGAVPAAAGEIDITVPDIGGESFTVPPVDFTKGESLAAIGQAIKVALNALDSDGGSYTLQAQSAAGVVTVTEKNGEDVGDITAAIA